MRASKKIHIFPKQHGIENQMSEAVLAFATGAGVGVGTAASPGSGAGVARGGTDAAAGSGAGASAGNTFKGKSCRNRNVVGKERTNYIINLIVHPAESSLFSTIQQFLIPMFEVFVSQQVSVTHVHNEFIDHSLGHFPHQISSMTPVS